MCEFCNIEHGKEETLMESDLELTLGKNHLTDLAADVDISSDDTGSLSIWFRVAGNNGQPFVEMDMPIDYCPFCGRKLPRKD